MGCRRLPPPGPAVYMLDAREPSNGHLQLFARYRHNTERKFLSFHRITSSVRLLRPLTAVDPGIGLDARSDGGVERIDHQHGRALGDVTLSIAELRRVTHQRVLHDGGEIVCER